MPMQERRAKSLADIQLYVLSCCSDEQPFHVGTAIVFEIRTHGGIRKPLWRIVQRRVCEEGEERK
jgi:hypothetical protein